VEEMLVDGVVLVHRRRREVLFRLVQREQEDVCLDLRQMHQARIRTCTRSPVLRLLYVGVALILRNVWVWLHREVLARGRRDGRIDLNQLVFRKMLVWLQHVIEEHLGVNDFVATERPLLP
jgi:hypothetical protein